MNKYLGRVMRIVCGFTKSSFANIGADTKIHHYCRLDPSVEISVDRKGKCSIGRGWNARSGSIIRVRDGAILKIGRNFNLSTRSIITAREKIEIGDNVTFGPGVLVYDHDHDFRADGGAKSGKHVSTPIIIGSNVWIGAGSIILRGTEIADNCVVAAGTVVRGKYSENNLIYQHRETLTKAIEMGKMRL